MKTVTLYNSQGQTQGILSSSDPEAFTDSLGDLLAIEGAYNNNYYIADGQAHLKDPNPSTDETKYCFDYATKTWQIDLESTAEYLRGVRAQLLEPIDQINPVWFASLTAEKQNDLVVYRQQLLDVPQQTGFPELVEWPAKPAWL